MFCKDPRLKANCNSYGEKHWKQTLFRPLKFVLMVGRSPEYDKPCSLEEPETYFPLLWLEIYINY